MALSLFSILPSTLILHMLLVLDLEGSRHDIVSHTYFDLLEHHIFGHAFGMQLGELREENSGLLAQKSKLEVLLYATTILSSDTAI